jgi:hypothetical protein
MEWRITLREFLPSLFANPPCALHFIDAVQIGEFVEAEDCREGFEGAPEHRLMARALEFYMADRYEKEPEVKRRAEEARRKREESAS